MAETGTPPVIGVIGGSGVYEIDGLSNTRWEKVSSPFGEPRTSCSSASWTASPSASCRATAAATGSRPAS